MIKNINMVNQEDSLLELGRKQWACLDSLAEHYKDSDMSNISSVSKFQDDKWEVIGESKYNFRWSEWAEGNNAFPLILICKVVSYHAMQVNNLATSTIQIGIAGFLNTFMEILQTKSICMAERNQPFNALSHLSCNDISLLAQTNIANKGTLSHASFTGLDRISKISLNSFPNTEFLISGLSTPWDEQSLSCQYWVKQQKSIQGIDITTKSYPPLRFEVVSAIVKHAIPFISQHFDTIVGVFNEIEKFHQTSPPPKGTKINIGVSPIIKKKYGKALDYILPIQINENPGQYFGRIKWAWFSDLEQLAQGASAWIILLTTGLRNVDMRNLEKGCCQTSKRHDLLNYLITDIQKTHLSNYVLPVPSQTKKAVELLQLAKLDRSGDFLLSKLTTFSGDNSSEDNRKISDGDTFNRMIKRFASNYDISLDTISNDDNEATTHCIRTTLAGYIGVNSTAAILILKKLFGHSNALMPDAYLNHNPIVIAERNKNITNSQKTLADDMANGMISGKLSGTKGKQMLIGAEHIKSELNNELKNESLTQMQMQVNLKERIKEMLLSRIQENQIYALKTPMSVVCMRNCSDSSDTPCAKLGNHEKRKENAVSKEITDALATLPNPAQCVGKECSDALFGEAWSRDLLGTFDYYIKYLKAVGHQSIDIKNEAEIFVKNYGTILKDIYSDEREVGYFD